MRETAGVVTAASDEARASHREIKNKRHPAISDGQREITEFPIDAVNTANPSATVVARGGGDRRPPMVQSPSQDPSERLRPAETPGLPEAAETSGE